MEKILSIIIENRLYASIVIIIIGVIIYQIIEKTINRLLERDKKNHRRSMGIASQKAVDIKSRDGIGSGF